jgi:hypothetical protein
MARLPETCPVCNCYRVRPVLDEMRISASSDGEARNVGGLAAFTCEDKAHIFFVRASDWNPPPRTLPRQQPDALHSGRSAVGSFQRLPDDLAGSDNFGCCPIAPGWSLVALD